MIIARRIRRALRAIFLPAPCVVANPKSSSCTELQGSWDHRRIARCVRLRCVFRCPHPEDPPPLGVVSYREVLAPSLWLLHVAQRERSGTRAVQLLGRCVPRWGQLRANVRPALGRMCSKGRMRANPGPARPNRGRTRRKSARNRQIRFGNDKLEPDFEECRPTLAMHRPYEGRLWPSLRRIRQKLARHRSTLVWNRPRTRPSFARVRPSLARNRPDVARNRPNWADFDLLLTAYS